jgi:hypothetical protein
VRVLRWLGWILLALGVLGAALAGGARFRDGPLGPFPGGPLEAGELVREPVLDWRFAAEIPEIELQLVDPPRSRTTWVLVREDQLYVGCAWPGSFVKQWPEQALRDGRVVLRIAGRRYERQAVRVTDPEVHAELSKLAARKYGGEAPAQPDPDGLWFFRMDPRPGG